MKSFKKVLSIIIIFALSPMQARVVKGRTASQTRTTSRPSQKPVRTQPTQRPAELSQQSIAQPQSYAQALNIIRTRMPSNKVLVNNAFTQEFLNFATSLNLPDVQTQALLEAGVNLHATLTDNDQTTQQILSSLKSSIPAIIQSKPQPIIQPIAPKQAAPAQPVVPVQQPAPIKPVEPIQPIGQNIAIKKDFITHDAILILNPNGSESDLGGAMTITAIATLYEKPTPIIMTSNILENIIKVRQKISNSDLQKLRTSDHQQRDNLAKTLLQSYNIISVNNNELILISHIDFDSKNFTYYFHKSAPLVLVIPKQYIDANFINAANLNSNQQARACGFNPNIITTITNVTNDTLLKQLQQQLSVILDEGKFTTHLSSLFVPQKKDNELISLEEDAQWIMYLTGHGSPHQSIENIRKTLEQDKERLDVWQNLRGEDAKYWRSYFESAIDTNEKILQGKSSWPDSQFVPESGRVGGLNIENFLQLMKFFNKNMNMAFLHYATCFAGGSNQSFVNEVFSSLDVNFILSAEGIHEGPTSTALLINPKTTQIQLEGQHYDEFFRLSRLFITQPKEFVKIKGKAKDPIPMIIRTVILEDKKNQPFVRFPSTNAFVASPINEKTKILTQTLVKAHEIEKKPIDLSNRNISLLIVNTPRINVKLNLGTPQSLLSIVFPSPKNSIPSYESLHAFKEITSENTLQSFLNDWINLNARLYTQTFVINKLTGIWYQLSNLPETSDAIHHFIIQMKGVMGNNPSAELEPLMQFTPLSPQDIQFNKIGVNVQIAFELNGIIYQSMFGIKSFRNAYDIYKNIQKITFAPTTDMNAIARNFLTSQEIANLAQPITLQSIAKTIDSRIDKQDQSMAIWSEADQEALLKTIQNRAEKQKQK
jgi:hypothetical protein